MEFNTKEEADAALMKSGPNDRQVYDAFVRFYDRQHPGEQELGGADIPAHINEALNKEVEARQRGTQQAGAGTQGDADKENSLQALRERWGYEFGSKLQAVQDFVVKNVPQESLRELEAAYPGIGNDVRVLDLLQHLATRR